jgi:hypothetical protein
MHMKRANHSPPLAFCPVHAIVLRVLLAALLSGHFSHPIRWTAHQLIGMLRFFCQLFTSINLTRAVHKGWSLTALFNSLIFCSLSYIRTSSQFIAGGYMIINVTFFLDSASCAAWGTTASSCSSARSRQCALIFTVVLLTADFKFMISPTCAACICVYSVINMSISHMTWRSCLTAVSNSFRCCWIVNLVCMSCCSTRKTFLLVFYPTC